MCKFWRAEQQNHHFPELHQTKKWSTRLRSLTSSTAAAIAMVSLTVGVALIYIWQINVSATKGYQVNDLQQQIIKLQEENQKVDLAYAQLQSVSSTMAFVGQLGLVAVDQVETINPEAAMVALK